MAKGPKARSLVRTPAKGVMKTIILQDGKIERSNHLRVFLWDNPELRKAFKKAKERERK